MTEPGRGDWRAETRAAIEAEFATASRGESTRYQSPSGKYELEVVERHATQGWDLSEGVVRRVGSDDAISTIRRNYGLFPFLWCEGHPTGHDYLVAGEDYQGQTVVELDTGQRVDYLAAAAEDGGGFCWAVHHLGPDRTVLVVDGCFWACPYELVAYDFSEPMHLPYAELHRWPGALDTAGGFDVNGTLTWTFTRVVRLSDGKPYADLTSDEESDLRDENGHYLPSVLGSQICSARWQSGSPFDSTEIEIKA